MTDSNLVRHLQAQTMRRVGLVDWNTVQHGPQAIRQQIAAYEISLVDAVTETDLHCIAEAAADLPLVTGGSGLGMAFPAVWQRRALLRREPIENGGCAVPSGTLILSGSCSAATLAQLAMLEKVGVPSIPVDLQHLVADTQAEIDRLTAEARSTLDSRAVAVIRSSEPPSNRIDNEELSRAIEHCFGAIAKRLAEDAGVKRIIVAGGETSGSVVNALGVRAVEVGSAIDPGVPGLKTLTGPPLWLALKSGNFGAPDFFLKTLRYWEARLT